jgi:hypothetical protein
MQRYSYGICNCSLGPHVVHNPSLDGEYILYTDHAAQRDALVEALEGLVYIIDIEDVWFNNHPHVDRARAALKQAKEEH